MAVRKEKIRAQMQEATAKILEPGEQERASTMAISGWSPWLFGGLLWLAMVKYYFVVVTDRRIIFFTVSKMSQRPTGQTTADPLGTFTIDDYRPGTMWSVLRVRRADGRRMRLNIQRIWRDDLAAVVQAIRSPVAPPGPDRPIRPDEAGTIPPPPPEPA